MRPLRVGIVAESYYPTLGGIQEHVRHLRNLLDRQGVEVTILTGRPTAAARARARGRRAGRGPRRARPHLSHRRHLHARRRSARSPPTTSTARSARGSSTCSTSTGPVTSGWPFWALSMFRGPKVLTLHNASFPDAPWRHRIAPYYRWVFRRAAAVIAVSEATAQSMGRYADFQSTIIPNGVDVSVLARVARAPAICGPGCETSSISAGSSSATGPRWRSRRSPGSRRRCPTSGC